MNLRFVLKLSSTTFRPTKKLWISFSSKILFPPPRKIFHTNFFIIVINAIWKTFIQISFKKRGHFPKSYEGWELDLRIFQKSSPHTPDRLQVFVSIFVSYTFFSLVCFSCNIVDINRKLFHKTPSQRISWNAHVNTHLQHSRSLHCWGCLKIQDFYHGVELLFGARQYFYANAINSCKAQWDPKIKYTFPPHL